MNKRKLTSLALSMMLVLSLVVGTGTFALFTDTASNKNFFHAGTIDLGTSPEPMYYTAESHPRDGWMQQYDIPRAIDQPYGGEALGGWAPGDSIDREMQIINSGSLDAIVKGVHARINMDPTPGGVQGLSKEDPRYQQFIDKMSVRISDRTGGGTILFNGSLRDLLNIESGGNGGVMFTSAQQFIVGAPRTIDFNVTMALDADNELQGLTWVFDFVFYAEQQRNNPNQPSDIGTVEGTVKDSSGNPIMGATVDFGNGFTATTNENGQYSINLPAGNYTGTASKSGYNDDARSVTVNAGETSTLDFILSPTVTTGILNLSTVEAGSNAPVPNVVVTFYDASNAVAYMITTDGNGEHSVTLEAGTYTLAASKLGWDQSNPGETVTILAGQTQAYAVEMVQHAPGIASGKIFDALTGDGIPNLNLSFILLDEGGNPVGGPVANITTASDGTYSITLPAGNYRMDITDPNNLYIATYRDIISVSGVTTPDQNHAVTKVIPEGDWRIVLNWNASPRDLDAHLTGPSSENGNQRFHVYYRNKEYYNPSGFFNRVLRAKLDYDWGDTPNENYPGFETITISNQYMGSNAKYRYFVHDYTNRNKNGNGNGNGNKSYALGNSGATVQVYKGSTLLHTLSVPQVDGTLWKVLEIQGNNVTIFNEMSYITNPSNIGTLSLGAIDDSDESLLAQDIFENPKEE